MNILSIDFDYFQTLTDETVVYCYPDGLDLSPMLSISVWAQHYANVKTEEMLKKVRVPEVKFKTLKSVLLKQTSDTPVMIVYSHKHIYSFIKEHFKPNVALDVYNIDTHHDMFRGRQELDCGNWATYVLRTYPKARMIWIKNPISDSLFPLDNRNKSKRIMETKDLNIIKGLKFDMIFLCRSDNWFAPHLDDYFVEIYDLLSVYFDKVLVQQDIGKAREYEAQAKQLRDFYAKANSKYFK